MESFALLIKICTIFILRPVHNVRAYHSYIYGLHFAFVISYSIEEVVGNGSLIRISFVINARKHRRGNQRLNHHQHRVNRNRNNRSRGRSNHRRANQH